jgi:hypothetical protein
MRKSHLPNHRDQHGLPKHWNSLANAYWQSRFCGFI